MAVGIAVTEYSCKKNKSIQVCDIKKTSLIAISVILEYFPSDTAIEPLMSNRY